MAAKELCSLGFEEERLRRDEVRNLRARPAVFFGFREEEQSSRECERDARSGGAKGCRFRLHGRGAVEEDEEARHRSWSWYENALPCSRTGRSFCATIAKLQMTRLTPQPQHATTLSP
jgi:hypothetical protein